jgi:choline-sulfatase
MADEMRYPPVYEGAALQAFRQRFMTTENALRATGVEFHRHYAASTACAPSRTSLFTGQYPSLHGVSQTDGAAKASDDPGIFWLDPAGAPTIGDYFQSAGYRSFYRGKWHVSLADIETPGTREAVASYTDTGARDPRAEQLYQDANRLSGFGFDGWIGPEAHGSNPLNSASSPSGDLVGRDQGFAAQSVELLEQLDASNDDTPWLMVASFLNPHDIALWGFGSRQSGSFDFSVDDDVPDRSDLFDPLFLDSLGDDLTTKPSCQMNYRDSYRTWMQGIPPDDYWRFYYQLHKAVDVEMLKVYQALQASRFFENTIVVYTSDHGDMLGSHGYQHQKWHNAYDESVRVPLIVSNPTLVTQQGRVDSVTSHVDLLPTMLGLAGIDPADHLDAVGVGHANAVAPVGRNLSGLVDGSVAARSEPVYFMTEDEPSRGLNQNNVFGVAYDSVSQPNHIETVIAELDGVIWKYSRYFDNPQFWSNPNPNRGEPNDVVTTIEQGPRTAGTYDVSATERVKTESAPEEFEMYNLAVDPMELDNLFGNPDHGATQTQLAVLLEQERQLKRLLPASGGVSP